jgi:hypothetical protein
MKSLFFGGDGVSTASAALWSSPSFRRSDRASDVTALANKARLVPATLTLSILRRATTYNYSLLFHSILVNISQYLRSCVSIRNRNSSSSSSPRQGDVSINWSFASLSLPASRPQVSMSPNTLINTSHSLGCIALFICDGLLR